MIASTSVTRLEAGMPILYGGNQITVISADLAARFAPGDRLIVVQTTGDLLHVPTVDLAAARRAVDTAADAFAKLGSVPDSAITHFYEVFARRLEDDNVWSQVQDANAKDVVAAQARGRSTTRLAVSPKMRADMIEGLRLWRDVPSRRGTVLETVEHDGWHVEQFVAALGIVGFVFEGRPNVFADATGVLRDGNAVVFRIGSDALGTARAIMDAALRPALIASGLPDGAISLVDSPAHAAGWALFDDSRLALAVARGSGGAVAQLGAVARQAGVPVSLHGTGGAWVVAADDAPADWFADIAYHSLDRKVCNTLNVCAIVRDRLDLVPVFLNALERAGERRGHGFRLHVVDGSQQAVPEDWFTRRTTVRRPNGDVDEPLADVIAAHDLGREWEWEETPEASLMIVDSVDEAAALFNRHSPHFIASLITSDNAALRRFEAAVDAPFVGNGFTRWVDGQYALARPELGLSNWEGGRLFGRGGVLSGDSVYTVRTRAVQMKPDVHR